MPHLYEDDIRTHLTLTADSFSVGIRQNAQLTGPAAIIPPVISIEGNTATIQMDAAAAVELRRQLDKHISYYGLDTPQRPAEPADTELAAPAPATPAELHSASYVLHQISPEFPVTERYDRGDDGPTVTATEIGVRWNTRGGNGIAFAYVDVTGPRHLKNGTLGSHHTIRVYDLEQFPPAIRDRILATRPAP